MSRFLSIACFSVAVLGSGPVVNAQFEGGARYDAHSVSVLVDRVHADLDHAYFSSDDREHLNRAEKELREFAQTWDQGKFDVLDRNKLPASDRTAISDDIAQQHRMREAYKNHEIGI